MLWIKAFHIIWVVTWFSGLFYLPRLFVYHAKSQDAISNERFKVMERRLYYYITTPGCILTILFGIWLLSFNYTAYSHMMWLHVKLILVALLVIYHIWCGKMVNDFKHDRNKHTHVYFRWMNEIPVVFLVIIIILATVKPF